MPYLFAIHSLNVTPLQMVHRGCKFCVRLYESQVFPLFLFRKGQLTALLLNRKRFWILHNFSLPSSAPKLFPQITKSFNLVKTGTLNLQTG